MIEKQQESTRKLTFELLSDVGHLAVDPLLLQLADPTCSKIRDVLVSDLAHDILLSRQWDLPASDLSLRSTSCLKRFGDFEFLADRRVTAIGEYPSTVAAVGSALPAG